MFIRYTSPIHPQYNLCEMCEGETKSNQVLLSIRSSDAYERYKHLINSRLGIGQQIKFEHGSPGKLEAIQVLDAD